MKHVDPVRKFQRHQGMGPQRGRSADAEFQRVFRVAAELSVKHVVISRWVVNGHVDSGECLVNHD